MTGKTINITPYHCEVKPHSSGFVLEWFGRTEGGKEIKVKLKCEFWWIRFLAVDLWKVINYRKAEIAQAEKVMTTNVE